MAIRDGSTSVEELRGLHHAQHGRVFADLPHDFLEWLISVGDVREGDDADVFVEPNAPADEMSIILTGSIRLRFAMRGYPLTIIPFTAGAITGLLPYSRMTTIPARIYAVGHTRVLYIHRRHFPEMIQRSPELAQRLVSLMSERDPQRREVRAGAREDERARQARRRPRARIEQSGRGDRALDRLAPRAPAVADVDRRQARFRWSDRANTSAPETGSESWRTSARRP